jgi:hypothetical protein
MAVLAHQLTVGTSPTQVSVADANSLAIQNGSGSTVYIGGANVTTIDGFPVTSGSTITLDVSDLLYAIAASPVTVSVLAVGI